MFRNNQLFRKRKWIILFAPILMGVSTYLLTEIPPPVYTSEALTKVSRSSTLAALMTERVTYSSYDNMATQVLIIRSRPVLENVARKLSMVKPGEDTQTAFLDLRSRVNAEQRAGSDILAISGSAARPEEAVVLANTVVDAYIEAYNAERERAVKETSDLINRRYEQATNELNDAERELFKFKRAQADKLNLAPTMLPDLQQRQVQYRRTAVDLWAMLDMITRVKETNDYESFLQTYLVIDEPIARQMTDQAVQRATAWVDLRNKRQALLKYQTEAAPQVQVLNDEMKIEEQRLVVQLNRLTERLKVVIADNQRLLSTTETQQHVLAEQPSLTTTLDDLTLRVQEKQELVTGLRKQLQDAEIQRKEKVEEVTIVERAHTATTQPNRSRAYRSLVGALIGILIGGIFAFVLEAMDKSRGTMQDVEQHSNSVVVGNIPLLDKKPRSVPPPVFGAGSRGSRDVSDIMSLTDDEG
jgi:capsular polysaccharide biosynthesis protein